MTTSPTDLSGHVHGEEAVDGASLIAAERHRQIEVEGYSIDHDVEHGSSTLRSAARCYQHGSISRWPWAPEFWKPKDRLSDLIRAGALFLAAREVEEIERGPIGYGNGEAERCAYDINGILDRARQVFATAGLLATEQEQFAIRWDKPVPGLSDFSTPVPTREMAEERLLHSAFGGTVVSRGVTPWREQA